MTLYFFAWSASLLYGLEGIFAKLISKHSVQNPWLLNFLWMLAMLIFTIPVALFFGASIPTNWIYIFLSSIFFASACILNTLAISKLDISVLVPLFSLRTAMAVMAGALFLDEILTSTQYLLIFIIFIFGIFVSVDEKFSLKSFFTRNIFIALACMVSLVFYAIFLKMSVPVNGFWGTTLWVPIIGQFWLLFTIPFFKDEIRGVSLKQYTMVAGIGLLGVLGTLAATAAYAKNVSLATVVISLPLSMLIAFMFSVFAPELLEKHPMKVYAVRFISATVMVIAALNL